MTEKEIWMEKLMKYVEEMQKEWINICRPRFQEYYLLEMMLVSKHYWLIKWLVENDKIDREKFWNSETVSSKYSDFELSYDTPREDYTNTLLMELAIQDEPIQFLIEILR